METLNKEQISESLVQAMNKEDLHSRAAAKLLNLNPCYVSMARNSKSWDAMGKTPWLRLKEWFDTREPLKTFQIPEGEEIWQPKEKISNVGSVVDIPAKPPKMNGEKVKAASERGTTTSDIRLHPEYITMKEKAATLQAELDNLKSMPAVHNTLSVEPLTTEDPQRIKITLDIEINLVMNGHRLQI